MIFRNPGVSPQQSTCSIRRASSKATPLPSAPHMLGKQGCDSHCCWESQLLTQVPSMLSLLWDWAPAGEVPWQLKLSLLSGLESVSNLFLLCMRRGQEKHLGDLKGRNKRYDSVLPNWKDSCLKARNCVDKTTHLGEPLYHGFHNGSLILKGAFVECNY